MPQQTVLAGRERMLEKREKKTFFLQFDFCLFAGRCKKRKKIKTHRKRRVSVKRRKGTVHQKIESQSHVDGKSEEVSSSNTETQLGQVSGRSEIPISLTNDDVIYTKILILNSLCQKPFFNEVGTQTLESVSDVFSKWSFCGDGLCRMSCMETFRLKLNRLIFCTS